MKSKAIFESRSPRILIVRLSAIGDVIQQMPVACALREHLPEAFLAWAVEAPAATLLRGHPALDELIELPRRWLKSPRTVWQLRRRLRAMEFDVVLEAQGLTKAALLGRLSGAKRRIGYDKPRGRELSRWLNTQLVKATAEHVVDANLELLRPLGIETPAVRFDVPELPADRESAEEMIRRAGLDGGFALINPGAGWPSKIWPAERHATVARYLSETWALPSMVLWAGAAERALAEQIVSRAGPHAQPAPPTSLTEVAALSRRCRLFIGSDTGPVHLAAAVGTPCVGLYGPWPAKKHGPYGPQHIVLQKMYIEGSTKQRRNASPKYMEAITVEMVTRACDTILRRGDQRAA